MDATAIILGVSAAIVFLLPAVIVYACCAVSGRWRRQEERDQ